MSVQVTFLPKCSVTHWTGKIRGVAVLVSMMLHLGIIKIIKSWVTCLVNIKYKINQEKAEIVVLTARFLVLYTLSQSGQGKLDSPSSVLIARSGFCIYATSSWPK